ncbi:MAG TPA: PP2C family protein-serine/threonine phosphatase [Acidisarcina sp.]
MSAQFRRKKKSSGRETSGKLWSLKDFLVLQVVLVTVAVLLWTFFKAMNVRASFITALGLSLVLGNIANAVSRVAQPLVDRLPRPWNWVAGVAFILIVGTTASVLAQAALFALTGHSLNRFQWTGEDVRISVLVTAVVSLVIYGSIQVFTDTKDRLEAQNRDLQGQVQFGQMRQLAQDAELESAQEIQMHLLPRDTPQLPGFQIACAWQPAKSVSGDYFDVFPIGEGRLALVLADVSGKGVAAALLMANLQASVHAFALEAVSPSALCSRLNKVLCETIAPGKFITMFYGIIDANSRMFHYENAGHCLPLMVRADGSILMPASYSGVLGLFSHWTYQDSELQFEPGDCLLIVTDGVLEAADRNDEEYGYQRLISLVQRQRKEASASAHELRKAILADVSNFCEGVFQDDASLIVVTVD